MSVELNGQQGARDRCDRGDRAGDRARAARARRDASSLSGRRAGRARAAARRSSASASRSLVADLADRADVTRLAGARRRRRAGRERRAPGGRDGCDSFTPRRSIARSTSTCVRRCSSRAALLAGDGRARRGHVVLISSLAGKVPRPASSVYCATKFGLRGFGYSLDVELRGHGRRGDDRVPGFHPRGGHVRRAAARSCRRASARARRQEVADAVVSRHREGQAPRSTSRRSSMRSGARLFAVASVRGPAVQRRLGGDRDRSPNSSRRASGTSASPRASRSGATPPTPSAVAMTSRTRTRAISSPGAPAGPRARTCASPAPPRAASSGTRRRAARRARA